MAKIIISTFNNGKTATERARELKVSINIVCAIDAAKSWRYLMTPESVIEREAGRKHLKENLEPL